MEHFEGHGDHLCALGFEDTRELIIGVSERINSGFPVKKYMFDLPENKGELLPILYPPENPVQICDMHLISEQSKTISLVSMFPMLEGIKNRGTITNKFYWSNDIEGEIEIDLGDKGVTDFTFFAPFFRNNFDKVAIGTEVYVYLAGIAYFKE